MDADIIDAQRRRPSTRPARTLSLADGVLLVLSVLSAVSFLIVRPPVGDLFAARARESAAAHGVGLGYWFAWFDGTVPGHYSILEPYVAMVIGSVLLGTLSSIAVTVGALVVLAPTRHRSAGLAFAVLGAACNLWSGRVPFLFGMVFVLAAVFFVQRRRPFETAAAGLVAALITPTSAAFLIVGLIGVLLVDGSRRLSALVGCLAAGVPVLVVAAYFGSPGPEGFHVRDAAIVLIATALLLSLKTPPYVRISVAVTLVLTLVVVILPNGLGANVERLAWFCLTVACVATSISRRVVTYAFAGFTILLAVIVTVRDLYVAAQPMSAPSFYTGLNRELDSIDHPQHYRVETVFDGTHNAAYALLGHAQLARGYETQSDKKFNAILISRRLTASTYRSWLDENAVGYVVFGRRTLATNAEDSLIRHHRPGYLHRVWSDSGLVLYAVARPTPIVAPPGSMLDATQSTLTVRVPLNPPRDGLLIRIRWSAFLRVRHAPAGTRLERSPQGWTLMRLTGACGACELVGGI